MTSLTPLVDLSWLMALLQEKTMFCHPNYTCPCRTTTSQQQIFFCKDCMLGVLSCEGCKNLFHGHQGHQILQVFDLGYRQLGIKVSTMKDLFDVSDIEYNNVENYFEIVYVKKMQGKHTSCRKSSCKDISNRCEACGYELQSSTSKYCSIECKVVKETNLIITSYEKSYEEASYGTSKQDINRQNHSIAPPKFSFA